MGTDRNGTGLAGLGGMANCRRCRTRLGCVIPLRLIYWTSTPGGGSYLPYFALGG